MELPGYANCAMDRYSISDRLTNRQIVLSNEEFEDLMHLHLCGFLDQVQRSEGWDYRRAELQVISERLGGLAFDSYNSTFAREP